jgi:lysophospholipase L1-like esterase
MGIPPFSSAFNATAQQLAEAGATIKGDLLTSSIIKPSGGFSFPGQNVPNNVTPTLTLNTSSAGTNVPSIVSGAPNTAQYTFTNSANYAAGGQSYPYTDYVAVRQAPNSTLGFGYFCIEFESDDPSIMIPYNRTTSPTESTLRVVCDGVELFRIVPGIVQQTAQGGTATTLIMTSAASATNSYYNSIWFHITGGTGAGQYNQSTAYAHTTCSSTASSITTTILTVGGTVTGTFGVGTTITGTGVTAGTYITSLGTGSGGAGTYNLNQSMTVSSETISGTTNTVTFGSSWTTPPDNTSVFEVTETKALWTNLTNTGVTNYYATIQWNGERRMRHYRMEGIFLQFFGIYMSSALSTCLPGRKTLGIPCVWIGDSYSGGTGTEIPLSNGLASIVCEAMGWELYNLSIGGTGDQNPGTSFTAVQRVLPPVNAWYINLDSTSSPSGSFTLTQNSITVTFVFGTDTQSSFQTKLNTAFGSGAFMFIIGTAATSQRAWVMGLGTNANFSGAMTANFSGATGLGAPSITQYLGDFVNNVPAPYLNGELPFRIVLANGHNDTLSSSSAYTSALETAAVTTLIQSFRTLYPLAQITVLGNMYLPIATADPNVATCSAAKLAAVINTNLITPTGNLSFVDSLTNPWFTGSGHMYGGQTGTGTNDLCTWSDGVHPSTYGHIVYGARIARAIQALETN